MKGSFGILLQEKNYLSYHTERLRLNNLWQQADKLIKYLSRILWLRRLITVLISILLFIEQSLLFFALYSVALLLLPIFALDFLLRAIISYYRYRKTDRALFTFPKDEEKKIILWSCSQDDAVEWNSFFLGCVTDALRTGARVVVITPKRRRCEVQIGEKSVPIVDVAYFFHLRKKLRSHPEIESIFIYE